MILFKLKKGRLPWYLPLIVNYLLIFVELVFKHRSSALIFYKWNKNVFVVIFIISNRMRFKWKIVRGMKRSSFLQKSTLCVIMIRRKLHTVDKNRTNLLSHYKINQSTVSTAKRLASLTIDTLHLWNCMYMELEVQCTCMYDPNKCWFYISKT